MVVVVPADIVRQAVEYRRRKKPVISLRHLTASSGDRILRPVVDRSELGKLKEIAHGKDGYLSISFCGDTGSGKTLLLAEILKHYRAGEQPLLVDGDVPEIAMTGDIECFIHKEKLFFDMEGPKGTIPLMQLISEQVPVDMDIIREIRMQISDEEEKQRQHAVAKYFPRLALAFSNTFVYVTTQNPLRHQDVCDELLDLAKTLNPALTANAKPFLIIAWNQAELGKYVKQGQDGRQRDIELTGQLDNNETRKKMLELSFSRIQIITFPNKHTSKRDLHGGELFEEKMVYFASVLEMHRGELTKMRAREGLELPAKALLTIIPELVKQSDGGLIPSVPRALKEYMRRHPDEDQNVLKEVFLDLGRKSKVRCGKTEGALKEWRATSIRLSMLIAARNLAFRFLSEGVEAFPQEDQNDRAQSLYSKLLVYFKMVFCECQAIYPRYEGDGKPVYCKKPHHGHGQQHVTEVPVLGHFEALLMLITGGGSSYHDTWEGEFEMSLEDKKQLDEDLPKEMQQRTRAAARIWRRNNDERIEDHFKNFAEEGVSLLADYAARFSAVSNDVPLRPNRANRSRPDFHMEPLNPFCVACYQKVEAERQTFVLCDSCYAAWSRKVAGLYTTVESGPQLYATGKDGYVYGQAFPEAAADQNWKLRCIGHDLPGKIQSVTCSREYIYAVLIPYSSITSSQSGQGVQTHRRCLLRLERCGKNPCSRELHPPPEEEPAEVALHEETIFLVTRNGSLFCAPLATFSDGALAWEAIYQPRFFNLSPWPIRSIAFDSRCERAYILQEHLTNRRSTLYGLHVADLRHVNEWRKSGRPNNVKSIEVADGCLLWTTWTDGSIYKLQLPIGEGPIDFEHRVLVSPESSGFTSVAFVAEPVADAQSFLQEIPEEALTDAVSEEENEAEDGEALPFVQDADVQSVCEDNDASDLVEDLPNQEDATSAARTAINEPTTDPPMESSDERSAVHAAPSAVGPRDANEDVEMSGVPTLESDVRSVFASLGRGLYASYSFAMDAMEAIPLTYMRSDGSEIPASFTSKEHKETQTDAGGSGSQSDLTLVLCAFGMLILANYVAWSLLGIQPVLLVGASLLCIPRKLIGSRNRLIIFLAWWNQFVAFKTPYWLPCLATPCLLVFIVHTNGPHLQEGAGPGLLQCLMDFSVTKEIMDFFGMRSIRHVWSCIRSVEAMRVAGPLVSHRKALLFIDLAIVLGAKCFFNPLSLANLTAMNSIVNTSLLGFQYYIPQLYRPAAYDARNETFLAAHAFCWILMANCKASDQQLSGFPLVWVVLAHLLFVLLVAVELPLAPRSVRPARIESTRQRLSAAATSSATWMVGKAREHLRRRHSQQEPDIAPSAPPAL